MSGSSSGDSPDGRPGVAPHDVDADTDAAGGVEAAREREVASSPARSCATEFLGLARRWKAETSHLSSITKASMHPAYQRIIGFGPAALPLILQDLEAEPRQWFWALKAISGEDPVSPEDQGNVDKMRDAWLRWGRSRGLIR